MIKRWIFTGGLGYGHSHFDEKLMGKEENLGENRKNSSAFWILCPKTHNYRIFNYLHNFGQVFAQKISQTFGKLLKTGSFPFLFLENSWNLFKSRRWLRPENHYKASHMSAPPMDQFVFGSWENLDYTFEFYKYIYSRGKCCIPEINFFPLIWSRLLNAS